MGSGIKDSIGMDIKSYARIYNGSLGYQVGCSYQEQRRPPSGCRGRTWPVGILPCGTSQRPVYTNVSQGRKEDKEDKEDKKGWRGREGIFQSAKETRRREKKTKKEKRDWHNSPYRVIHTHTYTHTHTKHTEHTQAHTNTHTSIHTFSRMLSTAAETLRKFVPSKYTYVPRQTGR